MPSRGDLLWGIIAHVLTPERIAPLAGNSRQWGQYRPIPLLEENYHG